MVRSKYRPKLREAERQQRKRYLTATILTCIIIAMIGGTIHVVQLGARRMQDMRNLASYDLKEEANHVRAAGEDLALHEAHEAGRPTNHYTPTEADRLLSREQWNDLEAMVKVPSGSFQMGTNADRSDDQDKPAHEVTLRTYYLDKYLVTQAQYARFITQTTHRPPLNWKGGRIPPDQLLYPVTMVTWHDATAYCEWAGKRLPTEAEFEKAGRGSDGRRWPWGNKMEPDRLNTYYNVGAATKVNAYPTGVSINGAYDLAGNVGEWMSDDFLPYVGSKASPDIFIAKISVSDKPEDRALQISEQKNIDIRYKVLRGGSWNSDPFSTSLFHRNFALPNHASDFYGFRCASDSSITKH
ncbi:formylglycine-generating enzyme family protein [Polynucleobacter sphagniphilus]|jgi:gamma-glutamyl hercynylcysteine S-oxide synthase|uniref:formylglycine-generating enzyme family protein n=1 Tax=Polynucleobacter sphagniphilus TaxID=1743169 RepID=UPI00247651D5|nr:formylglycine-generating enzyme family protein [Polynucleobacter sphagniphilus]MDH6524582.1 iron(II)-dependent oxidoreductase [Polynucleobacter sphagniphilus]